MRDVGVVIVAGGSSTRDGAERSSSSFAGSRESRRCCTACRRSWRGPTSCRVVVVLPRDYAADPPPWIFQCDVDRLMVVDRRRERAPNRCATGSKIFPTKRASCSSTTPRARSSAMRRSIASSRRCAPGHRAIAALPVVDTLKEVDEHRRASCAPSSENDSGARRRRRAFRARSIVRAHRDAQGRARHRDRRRRALRAARHSRASSCAEASAR